MSDAEERAAQLAASPYHGNGNGGSRKGKRRGRARRSHTVAKVLLSSVLVLGLVTGLGVTFLYRHLDGNLNVQDLDAQLGDDRPEEVEVEGPKDPMNILVMGSDTREGEGNKIDGEAAGPGLSDTTIMIHLSADRQNAYGISIPRDSLVDRPDCIDDEGDTIPGASSVMWNAAFAVGGPACTIRQFEQLTGIRINNYVVVDFAGFRNMVDAIGGVEVCVPQDINDQAHGIVIKAGTREISGKEALSYVRVRHVEGTDGSDIQRIKRQQAFVAAMANKVMSGSILARPDQLIGFLDAATDSLTTDIENIGRMARIGYEFRDTGLKRIQFITVPWQYAPSDPNRVEWLPEAEELWEKVRNDAPLGRLRDGAITAADDVTGSGGQTESPGATESGSPADPETSGTPSEGASSPSESASEDPDDAAEERAAAGLCV
ncbi:LCP family protein [Nocardioides sp.]|uniref:LCP family protein n=1 Tax=Nocardioides sp. TaxID=35761 RepID=UPI001A239A9C|nr:LCP family protein [Nocardioides sp.]MBJ7357782.1 LCP family protein [Nocardioides sp.]